VTARPLLLSIPSYGYLAEDLCRLSGLERVAVEREEFPDGERSLRIAADVEGREAVLVGGSVTDGDTLELYDLATTLVALGAQRLTLAMPWYGYSTQERAVRPGEVVGAKTRAQLLSSIPSASFGNRILLLDLHSEGIPHYFGGSLRPVHVYGRPVVERAARSLFGGPDGFVLACTDAGRAKWVESLANDLGVPASFVFKRRLDSSRTEVTALSAQVDGRDVVIYDDMIRTGSSLVGAARAYRAAGARRLAAVATHGVFPGDALRRIAESGLFTNLVVTDSHPNARHLACDFLRVESCAELFLPHLRGIP
jgi:ribose-phosphate pyrophosphokinase